MSNKKMVQQARNKTRTDGVDILLLPPSINHNIYLQLITTYSIQTCALLIFRPYGEAIYLQYRLWSQLLLLIKNESGILGCGCIYAGA